MGLTRLPTSSCLMMAIWRTARSLHPRGMSLCILKYLLFYSPALVMKGLGTCVRSGHLSEEQFRCWEYMLEQNTQMLFDKELDTLSRGLVRRSVPIRTGLWQRTRSNPQLDTESQHPLLSRCVKQHPLFKFRNQRISYSLVCYEQNKRTRSKLQIEIN